MEAFFSRLMLRASFIDELLSDEFEALPGQKSDADAAARRLAAWCRACASGDWAIFARRLERDRLSIAHALAKFATVRRSPCTPPPAWLEDAIWIDAALRAPTRNAGSPAAAGEAQPFEDLLAPLVDEAEALLRASIDARALNNLDPSAIACLRFLLLKQLSGLAAPAIYERFNEGRKSRQSATGTVDRERNGGRSFYDRFTAAMKAAGFRILFEDKPVLLRLIASITRQWIEGSRELILRLDADLEMIRRYLLRSGRSSLVTGIQGEISDLHNGGRSVRIVSFADGARLVYKPKDLRVETAWHALVERLNAAGAPVRLKAVRALARTGYGWAELIEHAGCGDAQGCARFFRRAGAWLALFHCFAATDMHHENMIAAGEHPVPIDLELILQASAEERQTGDIEAQALQAASEIVANSVMAVGLLPAYGKSSEDEIFTIGGVAAQPTSRTRLTWNDINSDRMRPAKAKEIANAIPNLPHLNGHYATLGDHIDELVAGFEDYASFLLQHTRDSAQGGLFDGFADVVVRKVVRPTRFYYMLLQRLRDHRNMQDGALWSAQADFLARLADWDAAGDPAWHFQRSERAALVALNVPHFMLESDGSELRDSSGVLAHTQTGSGMGRAQARVRSLDAQDIAWQAEAVRQSAATLLRSRPTPVDAARKRLFRTDGPTAPAKERLLAEAHSVAAELARHAIRRGPAAAWVGLDWLGDSEVCQLVALGHDLYNGLCGIALFLAAHSCVTDNKASHELALAAVAHLRKSLRSRNSARIARSLGIGAATGLGSIVYALTAMSSCLRDQGLLADAQVAAELFTDDLIAADKQLDVIGGSAGAILGLLRLHRDTQSDEVLKRATRCGEHLLVQRRAGRHGRRSWSVPGCGPLPLNGMSHGAAGFAYALAALAASTGRQELADAASECIAFENSSYDAAHGNWPDRRDAGEPAWPCKWCHGAVGIGLARLGASKKGGMESRLAAADIAKALAGAQRSWPGEVDTLCCGTLGNIEFFCEAGDMLGRSDLQELGSQRLIAVLRAAESTGDYRWTVGGKQFNLGLFRGLAGIGYTCLRRVDASLPNVLMWE
ncbi:MAG TPA: type 2 lanthipeptide synthetase LanM family protein [Xanthobacteraceae bacterium]|jgi:type 2 lantibiotic biosynthesis protein LanM